MAEGAQVVCAEPALASQLLRRPLRHDRLSPCATRRKSHISYKFRNWSPFWEWLSSAHGRLATAMCRQAFAAERSLGVLSAGFAEFCVMRAE